MYVINPFDSIIMNKKEESGSPCIIPLKAWKVHVAESFSKMENKGVEISDLIHVIEGEENPKTSRVLNK